MSPKIGAGGIQDQQRSLRSRGVRIGTGAEAWKGEKHTPNTGGRIVQYSIAQKTGAQRQTKGIRQKNISRTKKKSTHDREKGKRESGKGNWVGREKLEQKKSMDDSKLNRKD